MNAHSSGRSGLPYSPIQLAPASKWLNRRMSSKGTWQTMAPKRSGLPHEHVTHQEAAVASPLDAQMRGRSHLAADQVFADGDEVVISPVAVCLECRLMPLRAEFAPATDVGNDVHPALLQPGGPDGRSIRRKHRDLESAVAVEQGRILCRLATRSLRATSKYGMRVPS